MPTDLDEQTVRAELHALAGQPMPRPGLADDVIARRRTIRRRTAGAAGGAGGAAALAVAAVLALGSAGGADAHAAHLRLAGYRFRLPHDATPVAKTPAACAVTAAFSYAVDPNTTAGVGAGPASQPAIASAVTSAGGCVSMTISDPYTPGSSDAPSPAFGIQGASPVTIDGDNGTAGTEQIVGRDMTFNGVAVPSGTTLAALDLEIPAGGARQQQLLITAAGVSEAQLQQIVASGLSGS